ncbi:MAG: SocA family protein [Treponema sp.]|nr:SocA family protein [Treponema sp.]
MDEIMFKNAVLAILKARPGMGSIQLRKALIIADAAHNALHGESITGVRYIKHKFGPVPDDEAFNVLIKMDFPLHLVEIIEEPIGHVTQNAYYAAAEPDYSLFTRSQIDILNYSAATAYKYGALRLSDMTHDDVYHQTPMGDEIPLNMVCAMKVSGYDTAPFTRKEKTAVKDFLKSDEACLFDFV